jgi:AraC family transcriptional regulator, ethanolamine operon transcriptional activator
MKAADTTSRLSGSPGRFLQEMPSPEGYRSRLATDADVHAANLTGWNQLYDQLTPGQFHGSISELWMGKLQVFREVTSHAVRQSCQIWPNSLWFGIPLNDDDLSKVGISCIDKDAIAVRSGGAEFQLLTPNNFAILGIVVEQQELAEYVQTTEHVSISPSSFNGNLLRIGQIRRTGLRRLFQEMLKEVSYSPQLLLNQSSRHAIRSSVLLALSEVCSMQVRPDRPSSTHISQHSLVCRIREYVLSRGEDPVAISDICRDFYVSRRTLQNAFHSVVGMSPVAYLRAVRLNGVRRMLRDHSSRVTCVQDAAARWGFWHLSQFACDYRKLFGERPSDSLRQRCDYKGIH